MTSLKEIRSLLYRWSHNTTLGLRIDGKWIGQPFGLQFKCEYITINDELRILFDRDYLDSTPAVLSVKRIISSSFEDGKILITSNFGYFSYSNLDHIWCQPTIVEILPSEPLL